MRKKIVSLAIMLAMTACLSLSGESLENVYKSGKLILVERLRIDFDSVPEDVPNKGITDFTVTATGKIVTTDIYLHDIKTFDQNGKFIKAFGQRGAGPGDLNYPSHIASMDNTIIVWEIRNRRFSLFTEDGKYTRSVKRTDRPMINKIGVLNGKGLVVENEKYNYGQDIGQECILQLYSTDLELKKDIYQHHVLTNKFISKPVRTNVLQPFQPLVSWDVSPNGNVVIGFQKEYTIEVHDIHKGKMFSFSHKHEPVKVTEEDKKRFFDGMTYTDGSTTKKGAPRYIKDNTTFPTYKPVFAQIIVDSENNILVFPDRYTKSKDKLYFDTFDPKGTFIGKVETDPAKINIHNMRFVKNALWTTVVNDDDEYILIKYKIGE